MSRFAACSIDGYLLLQARVVSAIQSRIRQLAHGSGVCTEANLYVSLRTLPDQSDEKSAGRRLDVSAWAWTSLPLTVNMARPSFPHYGPRDTNQRKSGEQMKNS